jgi:hypothetical protein
VNCSPRTKRFIEHTAAAEAQPGDERCQKTEYALVSSLQRDPMLTDRIKRLRTIPGVGPVTALTWALDIGDVSRFRTIEQAIATALSVEMTGTQATRRCICRSQNSATNTSTERWSKLPNWRRDKTMNWLWSTTGKSRKEMAIGRHSPSPGRWLLIYLPWIGDKETLCLRKTARLRQHKLLSK